LQPQEYLICLFYCARLESASITGAKTPCNKKAGKAISSLCLSVRFIIFNPFANNFIYLSIDGQIKNPPCLRVGFFVEPERIVSMTYSEYQTDKKSQEQKRRKPKKIKIVKKMWYFLLTRWRFVLPCIHEANKASRCLTS